MGSLGSRRHAHQQRITIGAALIVGIIAVVCIALWSDEEPAGSAASTPRPTATTVAAGNPGLHGPVFAFLGDAYTNGARATSPNRAYPRLVCEARQALCDTDGEAGTGYINTSTVGGQAKFVDRVSVFQHEDGIPPDLIIVQGGLNDPGNWAEVEAAASITFVALTDLYPSATVIAVGPVAAPRFDVADLDAVRRGISAAAAKTGVTFLDPIADNWIPNGSFYDEDQTHLNDAGYKLFADRLLAEIPTESPASQSQTPS